MGRIHLTPDTMLAQLQVEYHDLEKLLMRLSTENLLNTPVQGDWSVRDILAHLTAWDKRGIEWISTALEGNLPHIPAPYTTWSGRHQLNKATYEAAQAQSVAETLATYRETFGQLLELIEGMDVTEWDREVGYLYNGIPATPIPMATLIRWRLNHLKAHKKGIVAYLQQP